MPNTTSCPILLRAAALVLATGVMGCVDPNEVNQTQNDETLRQVASIEVTPAATTLTAIDATREFTAVAKNADGTTIPEVMFTWSTSASGVATVGASDGVVTAVGNGTAMIDATSGEVSGQATVTVAQEVASVAVAPAASTLVALGQTVQLVVTARDANDHAVVGATATWSSSDPATVDVDPTGTATALDVGDAIVTATVQGRAGQASVTVVQEVASVEVTPGALTLAPGETAQLTAAARDANQNLVAAASFSWSSQNSDVVDVDQAGVVTGGNAGFTTVDATAENVSGSSVITVEAPPMAYSCTQVIGFSQTRQWFLDAPDFESVVSNDEWQLLFQLGAAIDRWADPDFSGWDEPLSSPCGSNSTSPDRILLTISGGLGSDPSDWATAITGAIAVTRAKYPSAASIVLQPVVGAPNNDTCGGVRAAENHPVIDAAIAMVVGGDVIAGASPEVRTCTDYGDTLGHFTNEANGPIGRTIGEFYVAFGGRPSYQAR